MKEGMVKANWMERDPCYLVKILKQIPFTSPETDKSKRQLTFAVIKDPKSVSILVSIKLTNNHIRVLEDEPQVPVMNNIN